MSYFKAQVNYTLLPQTVTWFAGDLDNTAENKYIFGKIVSKVQQRKCTSSNSIHRWFGLGFNDKRELQFPQRPPSTEKKSLKS